MELLVVAGGAIAGPMGQLAAEYEKASGQKLVLRFGTTPVLIGLATRGGPFDLGVVPVDVMQDAAARARFASGPTIDIARAGLGIAVRAGAHKPDIGSDGALKRTLLEAHSIATIPASAGGTQVLRVFEALGIGEAMKAKIRVQSTPAEVVNAVAGGEAELGIFLRNVLIAPGLEVVGPISASLHQEVVFTAALSADTRKPGTAQTFIDYLKTPAAMALLEARGLIPA